MGEWKQLLEGLRATSAETRDLCVAYSGSVNDFQLQNLCDELERSTFAGGIQLRGKPFEQQNTYLRVNLPPPSFKHNRIRSLSVLSARDPSCKANARGPEEFALELGNICSSSCNLGPLDSGPRFEAACFPCTVSWA